MKNTFDLDVKRIQGLSDAIFAVAMTILILDVNIPTDLQHRNLIGFLIHEIIPALSVYFVSFIILGAYWVDSHFHHHLLFKTDRTSSWFNILFLMFICTIPFSARFLSKYRREELSIIVYCLNLTCANIMHFLMLKHAWKSHYIKPHISSELYRTMKVRIILPAVMYMTIILLSFFTASWVRLFFSIPLIFHIFWGRSMNEVKKNALQQ